MSDIFLNEKLKDVCDIFSGNSINEKVKQEKYTGLRDGLEYISTKDIGFNSVISYDNGVRIPFKELSNFKVAPKHSIFICAEGGSAGKKIAISDRELCFVNKLFAVVAGSKALPKYIYYWLKSPEFSVQFQNSITGLIGGVSLNKFRELEVKIPSLATQQKIVEKLDAIFAEIDKATAAAEANIKNADALFQSYLTQVFEEGGEGWADSCISDVADLVDSLHKTPKYADDGYPMVRVTDIKSGPLNLSSTKKVDEVTFLEFSKRHKPAIGDIVFSRVGSYGVSSYVDSEDDFCLGQNTVFIVPKINSRFLYFFLNSPIARRQYDSLKDGVTQPTISLKSIKSVNLRVPSHELQKQIASELNSMYAFKNSLLDFYVKKVEELNSFRTSVLRQAFNGELVKE